jgi:hypothetical protein
LKETQRLRTAEKGTKGQNKGRGKSASGRDQGKMKAGVVADTAPEDEAEAEQGQSEAKHKPEEVRTRAK